MELLGISQRSRITQNNANNAWNYNSQANNNNKNNSYYVLPVFDYHLVTIRFSVMLKILIK